MRLVSFTVVKYRSIKSAHKIKVERQTVLVGPNNEGKSNLIRALVTAMRVLTSVRSGMWLGSHRIPHLYRSLYDWERDFPVGLQKKNPQGQTEITLELLLAGDEIEEFRRAVKSDLNGTLPLRVSLGPKGDIAVKVTKKGPGGKVLTAKSRQIAQFVSERVNFEHIQAVRTASSAQRIVQEMVERELETLESDPRFTQALEPIAALQQPLLDQLSASIRQTLAQFLPDVVDVRVRIPPEERVRALRRSCQILVDDGTETLLEHKGDGVQSLAALGIMRFASDRSAIGRNLVVAIEEPESHLHPAAIHALRTVLADLSSRHQIVLTTHNPLFVDRTHLRSNIIVQSNKARPAKSVAELRDILGVRASDNLRHAEIVLMVEGTDDRAALGALLSHVSPKCREALASGTIALEPLEGASNLSYKASIVRDALCLIHAFLDDDAAGRTAFENARMQGLLTDGDVNWATAEGMAETELEDLYDPAVYTDLLQNVHRVSLQAPEFRSAKKWSARMSATFKRQGKRWDDRIASEVKAQIAQLVAAAPERALLASRRGAIDGLARALEQRLSEVPGPRGSRRR